MRSLRTGGVRPGSRGAERGFYSSKLGEFVLPYDAVRSSGNPEEALLAFFQTTYEAAAEQAGWDREALEFRPPRR